MNVRKDTIEILQFLLMMFCFIGGIATLVVGSMAPTFTFIPLYLIVCWFGGIGLVWYVGDLIKNCLDKAGMLIHTEQPIEHNNYYY